MTTYNTLPSYNSDYTPMEQPNGFGTLGRMVVDGNYIDGSWELVVHVSDLNLNVTVRVRGDITLGQLMHRTAEATNRQQSWSGHGIWWPSRNRWLLHTKSTLDQYGIQSDARLEFRPINGDLQIVLPSQVIVPFRVSYAARVFNVVRNICKELNIRYPEEFSLTIPITKEHMKSNRPLKHTHYASRRNPTPSDPRMEQANAKIKNFPTDSFGPGVGPDYPVRPSSPYGTLQSGAGTMMRLNSMSSLDQDQLDERSLRRSAKLVFGDHWLMQPKNLVQKARLNSGWLDSSRSLLEQGICPAIHPQTGDRKRQDKFDRDGIPTLNLSLKYYALYDLNLKYDAIRLNQIYEQARWSILASQFECTEDEMIVFAAYQVQAELQSAAALREGNTATLQRGPNDFTSHTDGPPLFDPLLGTLPRPSPGGARYARSPASHLTAGGSILSGDTSPGQVGGANDELDELLSELEQSCGVADEPHSTTRQLRNSPYSSGTMSRSGAAYDAVDTDEIPTLQNNVRVFRERKLFIRRYRIMWAIVKETRLRLYESRADVQRRPPVAEYSLCGCSVTPDVRTASEKYIIKLSAQSVSVSNGHTTTDSSSSGTREELWLRFDTVEQYANWLAAFRLGAEGRTLASRLAFDKEVETILNHLRLQVPGPTPVMSPADANRILGDLTDFCADKIIRKARSREALRQRISEAHANIRDLSLLEAKLRYVRAWQRLNNFGRSYFAVKFDDGVRNNLSVNTGGLFSTPCDDLLAVSQGRIEVVNPFTGDVMRAWNFTELRSWNVNWDADKVVLEFRSESIKFTPLSTNCKTIVEFIGGYVFLGQRNPEKSSACNERQFHRLTCATDVHYAS